MNLHQTPEDIIKAANPAQKIIWNELFLTLGKNISIRHIVSQLGGSFLVTTYSANTLFFIYEMSLSFEGVSLFRSGFKFYDRNNNLNTTITCVDAIYNSTTAAVNYLGRIERVNNIVFSRLEQNNAGANCTTYFTGYKIGY